MVSHLIGMTIDMSDLKEAQKKIETQLKEIKHLKDQLEAENLYLRQELKSSHSFDEIVGESNILKHILYRVEQVAPRIRRFCWKVKPGRARNCLPGPFIKEVSAAANQ